MRFLTQSPLPHLRDLLSLPIQPLLADDELALPWKRPGDTVFWFSRSAWSLLVVAEWKRRITTKPRIVVWFPDFFCNESLGPLRQIKEITLCFYPIKQDLNPDYSVCYRLAKDYPPDLFVLVHYFGQPADSEPAIKFCKETDACLLEDAVHVLKPVPGVGEKGDFVAYSPHKHLPVSEGALLVVRGDGPSMLDSRLEDIEVLKQIYESICQKPKYSYLPTSIWLFKRTLQRLGIRPRFGPVPSFSPDSNGPGAQIIHPRMDEISKKMLGRLIYSLDEVANVRQRNSELWIKALSGVCNIGSAIAAGSVKNTPYLVWFECNESELTEEIFRYWYHVGLPVTTWPDLPSEVVSDSRGHNTAIQLRKTRIYLPVHQSLTKKMILDCVKPLKNKHVYESLRVKEITEKKEWDQYWSQCSKANLLQSWEYGVVKEETEGWRAVRLLFFDINGQPISLCQVLSIKLKIVGGVALLNRGPLLLGDQTKNRDIKSILASLQALFIEAKHRRWWFILLVPELRDFQEAITALKQMGLYRRKVPPWASGLLDLSLAEKEILMGFNGKWRNSLMKGEKLGVVVSRYDGRGPHLNLLLRSYKNLQRVKGFSGLSEAMIRKLAMQEGKDWRFNLFVAQNANVQCSEESLGVLVTIRHGDTSTYLIGSTSDEGRKMQANQVMLWAAILSAKQAGCKWFDIGGLNESTPKGVAHFKRGMNAVSYRLIGQWFWYYRPWH